MCGLAGISSRIQDSQVQQILESLKKRGPDGEGFFQNQEITFLHSRLAIIDPESRSNQPMISRKSGNVIIFNGEIYNYKEIKEKIKREFNVEFSTNSDTEVILLGYEVYGNTIWSMLSGMFAVGIYDSAQRKIVLARDHAGIKPLYYHINDETISFSSEVKNLFLLSPDLSPTHCIAEERLQDYFVLGYIPSPYTLYKEIFSLEKSSFIEFSLADKKMVITRYEPHLVSDLKYIENVLDSAIMDHLVSDVPVSLLFSGGTDSSLIASILKKFQVDIEAFTLMMPHRPEDREYSKLISRHLGLRTNFYDFNREAFQTSYTSVMAYIDVPIADVSLFPTDYISSHVAKKYKVVLSGEGGDELFYGYRRHLFLRRKPHEYIKKLAHLYNKALMHRGKGLVLEKIFSLSDPYSYYALIASPEFLAVDDNVAARVIAMITSTPPLDLDKQFYLENMLLKKLDLMTMKNSLEGRVPLLSPKVFKFAAEKVTRAPASEKELKFLLKQELKKYLPENLVERKKSGFGFNPKVYMEGNQEIRSDFYDSVNFLKNYTLGVNKLNPEWIYENKSGLALAMIVLHKSILNHKI